MTLLLLQKLRLRDFNTVFLLHLLNLSLGNLKPYYSSLLSLFLSLIKLSACSVPLTMLAEPIPKVTELC